MLVKFVAALVVWWELSCSESHTGRHALSEARHCLHRFSESDPTGAAADLPPTSPSTGAQPLRRTNTQEHRVAAAGGAARGGGSAAQVGTDPGLELHARARALPHAHATSPRLAWNQARFLSQLSKEKKNREKKVHSQGKKLKHPAKKPVHSKVRKKRENKKKERSHAGQGGAAKVDFLVSSPVAPVRGAWRRRAGQRGALAGSGRGAPVPPAPAGSMNESAWK